MSTYPISLLHDNSILIVDRDIVLCMIMDTCMSWVCHVLHCFAVSNCAAFWPIFLDHGTIGKNMELYYWIAGGVLPKNYCSICLYSVSYVSLPSRHCTVIPKTIEHDRTVVYHELGRLYWMYCMAELCCFSEAIVHSKRFLPSDFLRHTFNTIQGRRYDVNVMRGTAMKIERISRHLSCLQHKLWCRYTLYLHSKNMIFAIQNSKHLAMTNGKTPLCSGALLQREEQAHQRTEARCVGLIVDSQDFKKSCAAARKSFAWRKSRCGVRKPNVQSLCFDLRKSTTKKHNHDDDHHILCIFQDHLIEMMYNSTWPSLSYTFFCRPVINSRRHVGWDMPERVGVWGGQVRISLKS